MNPNLPAGGTPPPHVLHAASAQEVSEDAASSSESVRVSRQRAHKSAMWSSASFSKKIGCSSSVNERDADQFQSRHLVVPGCRKHLTWILERGRVAFTSAWPGRGRCECHWKRQLVA